MTTCDNTIRLILDNFKFTHRNPVTCAVGEDVLEGYQRDILCTHGDCLCCQFIVSIVIHPIENDNEHVLLSGYIRNDIGGEEMPLLFYQKKLYTRHVFFFDEAIHNVLEMAEQSLGIRRSEAISKIDEF